MILGSGAAAQSSWDRYQPGTLQAIIQLHDSSVRAIGVSNRPNWVVSAKDFATRARVVFGDKSRPTDSLRTQVIRFWLRSAQLDTANVQSFAREYLFREGGQELWIPVQNQVAAFFPKELRQGQVITVYALWLGAHYAGGDITWAFIINEFDQ